MISVARCLDPACAADVADLAAQTFPLACPPAADRASIAAFIAEALSENRFREYIADSDRAVFTATDETGTLIGYTLVNFVGPADPDVAAVITDDGAAEVSKMYVRPDAHGSGTSAALMASSLTHASDRGSRLAWLGVNQENVRAQTFYRKQGFEIVGTKTFRLGSRIEHDFVMSRAL